MAKVDNPRWPHRCRIYREIKRDVFSDELETVELYSGCCRSYTRYRSSESNGVLSSTPTLSIPLKTFDWETCPMAGDLVEVERGNQTIEGEVVDFEPNNLGTDITWKYVRN